MDTIGKLISILGVKTYEKRKHAGGKGDGGLQ